MFSFLKNLLSSAEIIITVSRGDIRLTRGKVPHGELENCHRFFQENSITDATVYISSYQKNSDITFSKHFPEKFEQRFRNFWNYG